MKIIVFFIKSTILMAMTFEAENISKLTYIESKKYYEVVITNKAAFYKADPKILPCLQKGFKEKVKLEIDPMKLIILDCK